MGRRGVPITGPGLTAARMPQQGVGWRIAAAMNPLFQDMGLLSTRR